MSLTIECEACFHGEIENAHGTLVPCRVCEGSGNHVARPGCECPHCDEQWFIVGGGTGGYEDVLAVEPNEFAACARAGVLAQQHDRVIMVLDRFQRHRPFVFVAGGLVEVRQ